MYLKLKQVKKYVLQYGSWICNYLMQSMSITTDVVSLNLDQGEVYTIMW
jgi:hypothetical protein